MTENKEKDYVFKKTTTFNINKDSKMIEDKPVEKVYENVYRAYCELDIRRILSVNSGIYDSISTEALTSTFKYMTIFNIFVDHERVYKEILRTIQVMQQDEDFLQADLQKIFRRMYRVMLIMA